MSYIDLTLLPYDDGTVTDVFETQGCAGIENHFMSSPINVGDTIEIGGIEYRIVAVKVKCSDSTIYSAGHSTGAPDHTRVYADCPVKIQLWLEPL